MILADKIIRLRKKNGWSQEELAEKMNVSRQAVSKWEGAQTIPDLGKLLQLSTLFGVTTDYLLKDEIEDEELSDDTSSDTAVNANGYAVTVDVLTVSDNATLTLDRGTYIIDEFVGGGKINASANANVIVLGDNKPEGYVEIELGDKKDERNIRYAECDGLQFEIHEYNNLYGVIANEDMLVEITEKTFDGAVVAEDTRYFFVDASVWVAEVLKI